MSYFKKEFSKVSHRQFLAWSVLMISGLSVVGLSLADMVTFQPRHYEQSGKVHGQIPLSSANFARPPVQNQVSVWWHWMNGNITKEGITKDLEAMKLQGINGSTILNVHRGDIGEVDCPKVHFGSPEWFDMFKFALAEANRLGMTIGTANCDGWSESGGPWITPEKSMKQTVWRKTYIEGGGARTVTLKRPIGIQDYYQDACVVAYLSGKANSFVRANPAVTYAKKGKTEAITDGNPFSTVPLKSQDPIWIRFAQAFTADELNVALYDMRWLNTVPLKIAIEASDDGEHFRPVAELVLKQQNELVKLAFPLTTAKTFRLIVDKDVSIGEMALLRHGERNTFEEGVAQFIVKSVSSRPLKVDNFWAIDPEPPAGSVILSPADVINLTGQMDADGTLRWDAPPGDWTVVRFGYTTTGFRNHPASPQGVGLECDKMDPTALDLHFRSYPQKLIDLAGSYKGTTFKYFLVDSWECHAQNWTANFPREFERRRGYSIIPWIPVLCGEVIESTRSTEAFLHDFRMTTSDLIMDYYFKHLADLCHEQGMQLYSEGIYGTGVTPPVDVLKTYKYCDVPMTEFWADINGHHWPTRTAPRSKLNSVGPEHSALLYDKLLVAAEAYTSVAIYSDSPIDLKLFGDCAFTSGVNAMFLHSYTHQPIEKKPGLTLGIYGQTFNRHNTWFAHGRSFFDQQARVQYLLQRGTRRSDVLVYLGDRMPSVEYQAEELAQVLPPNAKFNYCNAEVFLERLTVHDGEILLDGKHPFQYLVVRDTALNIETARKVEALVKDGAVVFAPKPKVTLSLKDFDVNNAELRAIADRVWGAESGGSARAHAHGKGRVVWNLSEIEKIYAPDFEVKCIDPNSLMHLHKHDHGVDIYYLVNPNNVSSVSFEARFRVSGKTPAIWDPLDGKIHSLAVYSRDGQYTALPLTLRAKQSVFIVFTDEAPRSHFTTVKSRDGTLLFPAADESSVTALPFARFEADGRVTIQGGRSGDYIFLSDAGKTCAVAMKPAEVMTLSEAEGTITFANEPELGAQPLGKFISFTESSNPLVRYYSGDATYRMSVTLPPAFVDEARTVSLQLEQFGSTAAIDVNGRSVATIWDPTEKVDITDCVKAGVNDLTIMVTNPWRNRLIGDKVKSRGDKDLWTTSPMIIKRDPVPAISKDAELFPAGISEPIKIFSEHPMVLVAL